MLWRRSGRLAAPSLIAGSGTTGNRFREEDLGRQVGLWNLIGVDFFGHVTDVELGRASRPADDTVLAEVGRLNQLQRLWRSNASASPTRGWCIWTD